MRSITELFFGRRKEPINPNLFVVKLSPGTYPLGFAPALEAQTKRIQQKLGKTAIFEPLPESPSKLSAQTDILVDSQYDYSAETNLPGIHDWIKNRKKLLKDHPDLVLVVHTGIVDPIQAESAISTLKTALCDQPDRVRALMYRCTEAEMINAILPGTMDLTFNPKSAGFSTHDVRAAAEAQKDNQT